MRIRVKRTRRGNDRERERCWKEETHKGDRGMTNKKVLKPF